MKKRKGFTLIELVIAMAIVVTMAGATLTSNSYNEKEAINNVAVKCQTLIAAARNTAIAQRAPREVKLNYAQNQITSGAPGGELDETYAFPTPVTFATGGTVLIIYYDAFGKLETYDKENRLTDVLIDSQGELTDHLSFFLTNKVGALVEEVKIYQGGGSVDLSWGGETPNVGGTPVVKISGPAVGYSNTNYTYSFTVQGGKPPYTYAWKDGGTPAEGTASTFTTQWAGSGDLKLTVTDSLGQQGGDSRAFSIAAALTASINSSPADWTLNTDYPCTSTVTGGAAPYSYVWTVVPDGNPFTGNEGGFTTQWDSVGAKTINLKVTDGLGRTLGTSRVVAVYSEPTGSINGPTSGLINTLYPYRATFSGGKAPLTYRWSNGGTASTANYSWAEPGTYWPSVIVKDAFGQTITVSSSESIGSVTVQSTLAVVINPVGAGSVALNPVGGSYNAGTQVTLTESPAAAYKFSNWGGDGNGTSAATTVTMNGDNNVTANFVLNQFLVTFNGNGGLPSPTSKTVTHASTYGPLATTTLTGYTFKGWFTATTGGTQVTAATTVTITAPQTLYAQWTTNNYTVTFNGNGGLPSPTSKSVTYASTYGPLATATLTGNTFKGWFTATTGGSQVTAASVVTITTDQTLYAQWTADSQTLTFNSNGGSGVTASTQAFGTTVSAPTAPTKTGYTFAGWYNESGLTTTHSFSTMGLSTTVYAKWTAMPFTITPSSGLHGAISPATVKAGNYGSSVTFTFTPESGYARYYTKVDGVNLGAIASYTFPGTTIGNHTIETHFSWYGIVSSYQVQTSSHQVQSGSHQAQISSTSQAFSWGPYWASYQEGYMGGLPAPWGSWSYLWIYSYSVAIWMPTLPAGQTYADLAYVSSLPSGSEDDGARIYGGTQRWGSDRVFPTWGQLGTVGPFCYCPQIMVPSSSVGNSVLTVIVMGTVLDYITVPDYTTYYNYSTYYY